MNFGELREAVHRGDWGALADATLSPDQEGYVDRMVGPQMKRYRDARFLLEADDPFDYEIRIRAEGRLGGILRWYACDVAEEALRLYGNGDPRSLKGIEVSRKYVLGEVGWEELEEAHQAARAAARAASSSSYYAAYAAVRSAANTAYAAAEAAAYAYADAAAVAATAANAAYSAAYYDEARANLEGWFRCYLMRWVEEDSWWA